MRLDKFLKVSRLIKRRTVANEACDAGRVMINDKPAKASAAVKQGDIIEIQFGTKSVKVEVLDVQGNGPQGRREGALPVSLSCCKGAAFGELCSRADNMERSFGEMAPGVCRRLRAVSRQQET